MDIQRIIEGIRSNDAEENTMMIKSIYENYGLLEDSDIEQIVPSIIYYLWKLPKFPEQKRFVMDLLQHTDHRMRKLVFKHILDKWEEIQLVRMDKFYFLLKRLLEYYPLNKETIKELFDVTSNVSLKAYIVRCIIERLNDTGKRLDEEVEEFLAMFVSKCAPALLFSTKSLKFRKDIVMKYAKSKEVAKKNRAALYSMIK